MSLFLKLDGQLETGAADEFVYLDDLVEEYFMWTPVVVRDID